MTISKFLTFLIFETRVCLQMSLEFFDAFLNHDVGMKSNYESSAIYRMLNQDHMML